VHIREKNVVDAYGKGRQLQTYINQPCFIFHHPGVDSNKAFLRRVLWNNRTKLVVSLNVAPLKNGASQPKLGTPQQVLAVLLPRLPGLLPTLLKWPKTAEVV